MKKEEHVKANNEFDFEKSIGIGRANIGAHLTWVFVNSDSMEIRRQKKMFFSKKDKGTETIPYNSITNFVIKNNFSLGDLISGIVCFIVAAITGQTLIGLIIFAFLLFSSWGKKIILEKDDGSKISFIIEALKDSDECEKLIAKLNELKLSKELNFSLPAKK